MTRAYSTSDDRAMDRARKLLAMSTSPVEEEARTAAHMLAQMLLDGRVCLAATGTPPPAARPAPAPPPPIKTPPPRKRAVQDYVDAIQDLRMFAAKFPGFCRECGGPFQAGDRVMWLKSCGATHADKDCAVYWERFL